MNIINKIKKSIATISSKYFLYWLSKHPDICLHDPKNGEKPEVRIGLPYRLTLDGLILNVEIENMRQYKRWRTAKSALESVKRGESSQLNPVAWLSIHIKPEDVFYDIGANIGIETALVSAIMPGVKILSFEPEPNSFLQLCRMIHRNSINATPYPFAISSSNTVGRFFVNRSFEAALSQHQFGRTVDSASNTFTPTFEFGAAAFSIDSLVQEYGLPAPNIVKIDVDGIEFEVITGMVQTIEAGSIHTIITEVCDAQTGQQLIEYFFALGFSCSVPRSDIPPQGSFDLCFQKIQ
jgi:FkbM family methyltransferase